MPSSIPKVSLSDIVGVLGIVLGVLLVIFDKAGKLKGPLLYILLVLAGLMTLFIAIGNDWVLGAPDKWKLWRGVLAVCIVGFVYSGLAIWIYPEKIPSLPQTKPQEIEKQDKDKVEAFRREQKNHSTDTRYRRAKEEETRPYFTLSAPGIKKLESSPPFRIMIGMENIGVHPATNLTMRLILVNSLFKAAPLVINQSVANDVPPKTPTPWYTDDAEIAPNADPMYITFAIRYEDALGGGKKYFQVFFMKWSGAKNGITEPDFVHVGIDEKKIIEEHQQELLKDFK